MFCAGPVYGLGDLDAVGEVGVGVCEVVLDCVWEGYGCSGGSGHVFAISLVLSDVDVDWRWYRVDMLRLRCYSEVGRIVPRRWC